MLLQLCLHPSFLIESLMSLRKQATSLAVMHAADILQPLLILPYAGRILGPFEFGRFAYAMSIGALATTLVEYGFHWTAQRAAASARQDLTVLRSLIAEVAVIKSILWVGVAAVGLVIADDFLSLSKSLFLCTMLTPLGGILFPAWLFIGLERAWQAAIAVVTSRCLALVWFLLIVTSPTQLEAAVAIQSAIPLVAGVVSLPFVVPIGLDGFRTVTPSRIGERLRDAWQGFLFSAVERALITLPVPLVGYFGGYVAAGQYSVAEKFVGATRPLFRVLSDTFLPRVAFCANHDPAAGIALIRSAFPTLLIGAACSLFLFLFGPYVIVILFGDQFTGAVQILRLLSIIPVLVNVNILTSNLYMFNYGHERAWASLTVSGLLIFLALAYLLSFYLPSAATAVAIAAIARECIVLVVSVGFFLAFGTARAAVLATKEQISRGATRLTQSLSPER